MSLTTSCPACGTMFRVVPDQLKISEGWVRCGHCSEVFDASAHLAQDPTQPVSGDLATQPAPLGAAASPPARPTPPEPPPPAVTPAPVVAVPPMAAERAEALARFGMRPRVADVPAEAFDSQAMEETPLDRPFVFRRSDLAESDAAPSVNPPLASAPLPPEVESGLPDSEPALQDLSFVRQARRRAAWQRPGVRLLLALLALLLAGLLAGQFAWQERDRLAAARPELAPAMHQLCAALGCQIAAPRQIDAIAIEASGFSRLRPDTFRLTFTVRNSAPIEVEAPAMELTLTDNQDQPVLRRVLTPADLGAASTVLPAASDWSGSVGLAVAGNGTARIAGYRLLAFYP